jgi:hypothetical protein
MAHSVTLVADHKGVTLPKAVGDEYVVDAIVEISNYVQGGITLLASELGLSSLHCVLVTGVEGTGHMPMAVVSTAGAYESGTSVKILLHAGTGQQSGTADEGFIRVRVWGNL